MSPGAIENLLRTAFAPPATTSRGPEPLALDTFGEHLRPAAQPQPQVSEKAAPPAAKQDEKPEVRDEEPPTTDETNAVAVAPGAPAPPPANESATTDETEAPLEAVTEEGDAEVKAKAKPGGKKSPPRAPEPAPTTAAPEAETRDQAAPTLGAETAATDVKAETAAEGKAASALVAAKLSQNSSKNTTEQPAAAAVPDEAQAQVEVPEEALVVTPANPEASPDEVAKIEEAAVAAAQKAAKPKADTKSPATKKRSGDAEQTNAAVPATGETQATESTAPVAEVATDEPVESNTRAPRKNNKLAASQATEPSESKAQANDAATTAITPSTSTAPKAAESTDSTAPITAATPDVNAAPDRAASNAATAPTPVHDSAPLRRASLTLQPPSTERTSGGVRLNEMEQTRFVQRVARAFEAAQQRDGGEIRLRLSPPELGSMRLELRLQGGIMSARIETETEAARSVLLDQLPALKERLAEHNIKVERFDVDLSDRRFGGQAQTPDQQGNQPRAEPRRPVVTRHQTSPTNNEERQTPRPSGDKGRLNVII